MKYFGVFCRHSWRYDSPAITYFRADLETGQLVSDTFTLVDAVMRRAEIIADQKWLRGINPDEVVCCRDQHGKYREVAANHILSIAFSAQKYYPTESAHRGPHIVPNFRPVIDVAWDEDERVADKLVLANGQNMEAYTWDSPSSEWEGAKWDAAIYWLYDQWEYGMSSKEFMAANMAQFFPHRHLVPTKEGWRVKYARSLSFTGGNSFAEVVKGEAILNPANKRSTEWNRRYGG